jgi:GNAT superfamily N-acetyltransferase
MIRELSFADVPDMVAIIDAAAQAYRGVIPDELFHAPYMSPEDLLGEIAAGITFFGATQDGSITGVIGIQDKGDVTLVRHAYVSPAMQRKGIGTRLLLHLRGLSTRPMLIGTWASATWAIRFYRNHGFVVVPEARKDALLRRYWSIPPEQVRASVVLADSRWSAPSITCS